jgi:alkanesulfonate monooxygenase SsuD/methylene tetrahydromethanopterin reductase-like flavin-dependent oxidoreductase (luciferase family)
MTLPVLRFNFATPEGNPASQRDMITAAVEMANWADTRGVAAVSVDEHHLTGHGWSSNPVMAAAMILHRTANIFVSIDCALGPLWNPIRLAEDIAFVDAISGGRLSTTIGLGYRPVEYEAIGADFSQRGKLMDQLLERMLAAWSGTPLIASDPNSVIRQSTWSQPHPPVFIGGSVRATARRAVRFRLGLSLASHLPDIAEYYGQLCAEAGCNPMLIMPARVNRGMIYLHEDPDKAWAELGHHILWEAVTYGAWTQGEAVSSMHLPGVRDLDAVRASGLYRFLTPQELVDEVRDDPDYGPVVLHPLVGGMPIDEAWKSLQLLTDVVLPLLHRDDIGRREE